MQQRLCCARGFTLVELLFVLVVAAVLASLAVPSFADALRRARRVEGVGALLQLQLAQERWRADHSRYTASLSDLGLAPTTADGLYSLALADADESGFTAMATASSSQSSDAACRTLKLAQRGGQTLRSSVDASGAEAEASRTRCWQ